MTSAHARSHLRDLEAESIHILREAVAEAERPVLLFSGGKDSAVVLHLAIKAFHPARPPFPVLHVDTGHNFPEVITFRDVQVQRYGIELLVASVQEAIDAGRVVEERGRNASRNRLQIEPLLAAIEQYEFDAVFGGARRDEEKARAKERVFSFRDEFSQWDPKAQRPEVWSLYNSRIRRGEHVRVFPISNWTEADIWESIRVEDIELPSIYFAHERRVFARDGMWMAESDHIQLTGDEEVVTKKVRFRTVGDMPVTGAFESTASTVEEIIDEIRVTRTTERGVGRADDRMAEAAMEDRKREGYF